MFCGMSFIPSLFYVVEGGKEKPNDGEIVSYGERMRFYRLS
jgi:hypothetical protein